MIGSYEVILIDLAHAISLQRVIINFLPSLYDEVGDVNYFRFDRFDVFLTSESFTCLSYPGGQVAPGLELLSLHFDLMTAQKRLNTVMSIAVDIVNERLVNIWRE